MLFVLLAAMPSGSSETDPLRLAVTPKFSQTGSFRAIAVVEPDAQNRWLVLCAESREYYRSSTIQLHGAQAARRHEMFFDRLPAGKYVMRAQVERANGEQIVRDSVVTAGTIRRR